MSANDPSSHVQNGLAHSNGTRTEHLIALVHEELRALAEQRIRSLGPGVSLQPTELVNEVFVKFSKDPAQAWQGQAHFVGAAAIAMRNILVDRARRAAAAKRGGAHTKVPLDQVDTLVQKSPNEILGIDDAITRLEAVDARSAEIVTLRFYLGLSFSEIAVALGVAERTVERDWAFARRWLGQELQAAREQPER